ncbi:16591_t:CDS:2, partial [Racocetra fulgida]
FENIYLQNYYSTPTTEHSTSHKTISTNDTSMFEDYINDFFEYTIKSSQANEYNTLYKVNQYLDEQIATKTTNVLEYIVSEQMFSCAGRIIDDDRASLDPDTVKALMYQQNWLEAATKFEWDL